VNPMGQTPNPVTVTDPRNNAPQPSSQKRPPSTIGEIVMAVFVGGTVVIYVILTIVSVQTEHTDQRAWMSVSANKTDPQVFTQNVAPSASIVIANTGKTSAYRFSGNYYVEVVKNGGVPHFEAKQVHAQSFQGVVFPNSSLDVKFRRQRHKPSGGPDDGEDDPLTADEKTALDDGQAWIAVHGFIRYRDVFRNPHWTRFCFWAYNAPVKSSALCCTKYTSTDDYPSDDYPSPE